VIAALFLTYRPNIRETDMIVDFTLGIGSNLVTDLVKYGGKRFLDSTKLGAGVKRRLGMLDSRTEDEFKKLLLESYVVYFARYPDRQFQAFYDFFSSEDVSRRLFDHILNFEPIDYGALEKALRQRMGRDWILSSILEKNALTPKILVEDFVNCYFEAERQSGGVGLLLAIREMRQVEQRIVEATTEASDRIMSSVADSLFRGLAGLESQFKQLGVTSQELPILGALSRDANRVECAIHNLNVGLTPIFALSERLSVAAASTPGVPENFAEDARSILRFARLLSYFIENLYYREGGYW